MNQAWRFLTFVLLVALALGSRISLAQSYPGKAVRIVVNMTPGGGADFAARLIGQRLTEAWKQPVLIDNRGGAGGNIGADAVAKAAPDGYTLLVTPSGLASGPGLYRKLPFDPQKDFTPISQIYSGPLMLVVNAGVPAASAGELIALAKAKPGSLNYGHNGMDTTLYLTMELFKISAGIDILAIPYKGSSQVTTALVAGEVNAAFMSAESVLPHVKSGKVRALGVASRARLPVLPTVPTMAEAGIAGDLELPNWLGMFAPAGTPRDILELIQREVAKVLSMPEVRDRFIAQGRVPVASKPAEFDAKFKADIAQFVRILKEARVPLQD